MHVFDCTTGDLYHSYRAVCGYSQVDLLAAAMAGSEEFSTFPDTWSVKTGAAAIIDLVSYKAGVVKNVNEDAKYVLVPHACHMEDT